MAVTAIRLRRPDVDGWTRPYPASVRGRFAVHRSVTGQTGDWAVTHVESGLRINHQHLTLIEALSLRAHMQAALPLEWVGAAAVSHEGRRLAACAYVLWLDVAQPAVRGG